ncbi:hypothetical protein NMY22_g18171 [Coprinellus aureogranulatus]|nr:hypothetical protein NMY22_g18171 [Coprinellus aureogranulatus]
MPPTNKISPEIGGLVDAAEAERLKALGNDAAGKSNYSEAYRLYSEAIEKNPNNAVYFANRAAMLLALKRYLDAMSDCEKAVEIDQGYVKAWYRLAIAAQALDHWPKCISSYRKALDCLPKQNLSPAEKKTREQCLQGLSKAKEQRKKFETTGISVPNDHMQSGKMPWDIAKKLTAAKTATGLPSPSVWHL